MRSTRSAMSMKASGPATEASRVRSNASHPNTEPSRVLTIG
jgi:hypothetical protein